MIVRLFGGASVVLVLLLASGAGADEKDPRTLVVIDKAEKEVKIKSWKLTAGTVHLSWLAGKAPPIDKKAKTAPSLPKGPQALEFREDKSTTYANGIKTLIPLANISQIDYDNDKKTVAVQVATGEEKPLILRGATKYIGINKLTIEAEAHIGDLGVASVKFQGGNPKDGIRGLRFSDARPATAPTGKTAVIIAQDKEKHTVVDLQPLYKTADGALQPGSVLYFKTTVKIDIARIRKLRHIEPENKKQASSDFEVTLHDGAKHTLTMLDRNPDDPKAPALVGLLGRVPAGYKLFPAHTITEVQMEAKE